MGLRDSGLNRTQMTAAQLSYGNNKAALDRQKQAQVDALAQQLAATLSELDINKSNAAASIRQSYDNQAIQNATELYNADLKEQTERYKESLNAIEKANAQALERSKNLSQTKLTALEKYNSGGDEKLAAYLDALDLTDEEQAEIFAYIYGYTAEDGTEVAGHGKSKKEIMDEKMDELSGKIKGWGEKLRKIF